jgi:hypothetical protein
LDEFDFTFPTLSQQSECREEQVHEVGWMIVSEFQDRGIAMAATAQVGGLLFDRR